MHGIVGNPRRVIGARRCADADALRYAAPVHTLPVLRILLLALLVALLPVRGYAGTAMHLPAAGTAAVAPCHAGVDADAASTQQLSAEAAACALCDICHGAMLATSALPRQVDHGTGSVPPALWPAWPAVEPEALFRPPRR